MRKYINIGLGILLIILAFWLVNVMGILNKKPRKVVKTIRVGDMKK